MGQIIRETEGGREVRGPVQREGGRLEGRYRGREGGWRAGTEGGREVGGPVQRE